jgi:cobalt/nickel transport system permease protein
VSAPLTLPEWFVADAEATAVSGEPARRARAGPVRRAVTTLAAALARELAAPPAAGSWLGAVEPRAKTIGLLGLTVGATLLHGLDVLTVLLAVTVALALSCGLGPRHLGRAWLGVPLFSLAIILPATLNVVTGGTPLLTLWRFAPGAHLGPWALPAGLTVTREGLVVAARFLLRSTDCVTLVLLLVATTGPGELVAALRRLGMPRAFGMVLAMAQRYLVVLLRAAEGIHLAKVSRTLEAGSLTREQRWVGAGAGILFRRTFRLACEVHAAMVSRGYDGDLQVGPAGRWRARDMAALAGAACLLAVLLVADRWV